MTDQIAYLDFEASALPPSYGKRNDKTFSYPISVGIVQDAPHRKPFYSLIQPAKNWIADGIWDAKSEKIHRLSLQSLSNAPNIASVAESIEKYLKRSKITHLYITHEADIYWANVLSKENKKDPFSSITFQDMTDIFHQQIIKIFDVGITADIAMLIFDTKPALRKYKKPTHNALEDAIRQRHIFRRFLRRTNAIINNEKCEENTILRALLNEPSYQKTQLLEDVDYPALSKATGYSTPYLKTFFFQK